MDDYKKYLSLINGLKQNKYISMVNTIPVNILGTVKGFNIVFKDRSVNSDEKNKQCAEMRKEIKSLKSDVVYLLMRDSKCHLHWFKPFTYYTYLIMNKQIDKDQSKNKD